MRFLILLLMWAGLVMADVVDAGTGGRVFFENAAPAQQGAFSCQRLYVEPSTLHCVSFQWKVSGDDQRQARIAVRYRRLGQETWREALDLLRMNGEYVAPALADDGRDFTCPNMFAGSIFYLEPATTYEVELAVTDPLGGTTRTLVKVATKALPAKGEPRRTIPLKPGDDLQAAFNSAKPGDHFLLAAGEYPGCFSLPIKGTRENPIVIQSAGAGEVVFRGDFHEQGSKVETNCLDVSNGAYIWIEGVTFRGHNYGVCALSKQPVTGLTVIGCRFEDCGWSGIIVMSPLSRDLYIADNVCLGTNREGSPLAAKRPFPYKGIWVSGQGVDVCYNRVQNSKDGISVYSSDLPPSKDDVATQVAAIDFYRNDVGQTWDDNEADGGQHNIRFWENRFTDMHVGLSAQPVYGGPCYFIRNVLYNITRGTVLKLNHQPAGVLAYHNTFVSYGKIRSKGVASMSRSWSNVHVMNNVFLGINGATLQAGPLDPGISELDYNGYTLVKPVDWSELNADGKMVRREDIKTLDDLAAKAGQEVHHKILAFSDFENIPEPAGEEQTLWDLDFGNALPKASSPAVDAGLRLPTINDDFTGAGPDLGAYERDRPLPTYGPRR